MYLKIAIKNQRVVLGEIKESSTNFTSNQAIKVNFRESNILIAVANGSTAPM